ncbi:MAG: DJ-1/PfpI family protein [Arcobacteraceae bacterium]|nr:DJ-1/PfpI family protein [Arcobacteraceae bacterium]
MAKKVLIPLATGFEEIEAVSLIDVLRRAGIKVIVAALNDRLQVQGANGIMVVADQNIDGITSDDIDMILLPGGWGGTDILSENQYIQNLLKDMNQKGKNIGAICAAAFALNNAGVLSHNFTCYPSVEEKIRLDGYSSNKQVVQDGNIITSRGPGTAICLGLQIVKMFAGDEMYHDLKAGLLADFCKE